MVAQQRDGQPDQVVEVHGAGLDQGGVVAAVRIRHRGVRHVVGAEEALLRTRDGLREAPGLGGARARRVGEEPESSIIIQDAEIGPTAETMRSMMFMRCASSLKRTSVSSSLPWCSTYTE